MTRRFVFRTRCVRPSHGGQDQATSTQADFSDWKHLPLPLTTDASKTGWGAHFKDIQLSGTWSASIARQHINILELLAIHLALKKLLPRLRSKTVTVRCDNMSVVSYIDKGGGTRSRPLCLQVVKVLKWCLCHHITLHAIHLPGEDNVLADSLSRKTTGIKGPSEVRGS